MIIKIGNFTVCGETKEQHPDRFSKNVQWQNQVAPIIRAASARVFKRGNKVVKISFSVTREHKDYATAVEFAALHDTQIPETGNVTVCSGKSTVKLLDGCIDSINCDPVIGCATIHSYVFIGGGFNAATT